MISICIPIYNFDVRPLVKSLLTQSDDQTEIILIDDASDNQYREINRELETENLVFVQLENNIGRSKIRNLFLKFAKNEFLLFLDCDSKIISNQFIQTYKNELNPSVQLICGGRVYDEACPSIQQKLRWVYGTTRESKTAEERRQHPNKSFMTNNFLIQKKLLAETPFDERLTRYGHEDTLLGIELENKGVAIVHIENPILNGDVETNEVFLQKTEHSLENLLLIRQFYENKPQLVEAITLLQAIQKIEKFRMKWLFVWIYKLFGKRIKKRLIYSDFPSVRLFNLYKICYFTK